MTIEHSATTDFLSVPHISIGAGSHHNIGHQCLLAGMKNVVMLVTDEVLQRLGLHLPVVEALSSAGIETVVFHKVQADPAESVVVEAIGLALESVVTGVIGFGGGSSMDVAKLVALMGHAQSEDSIPQCYGVNTVKGTRLPLIQIPTTAGTGSEVTPISIITTGETTKNACVSPVLMADAVILDAQFTANLPCHVAAATGIDAMVHALEAYTSVLKKNVLSDGLARQALTLLNDNILAACSDTKPESARQAMLMGSMLAGQAFANAPVGAVHALAYPLGGRFHIPHGNSNALVLCEVMTFNLPYAAAEYAQLAECMLGNAAQGSDQQKTELLVEHFRSLIQRLAIPRTLREYGIQETDLATLAQDAMQQTRLLQNNPRDVTYDDALTLYRAIL